MHDFRPVNAAAGRGCILTAEMRSAKTGRHHMRSASARRVAFRSSLSTTRWDVSVQSTAYQASSIFCVLSMSALEMRMLSVGALCCK